jgi:hypothetical protein
MIVAISQKRHLLKLGLGCQQLEKRLILSATVYSGQAAFRVGGNFEPFDEYI